ncbi:MAG: polymer-forming cytoskeletal protein [Candidatus Binatia bacterium]|nr:polymer-forming cytoskeletal protein [Candidatus Binatia bacterium]
MPDLERTAVAAAPGKPNREQRFRHQIEAGVSISGRIHFPGDARIDGKLKGEVRAEKLLLIGEKAELHATVSAQHMVLAGTMRGDVIRSGTVELEATARLLGNIEAKNLVVHAGAFFDGRAAIGKPAPSAKSATPGQAARERTTPAQRRANG